MKVLHDILELICIELQPPYVPSEKESSLHKINDTATSDVLQTGVLVSSVGALHLLSI